MSTYPVVLMCANITEVIKIRASTAAKINHRGEVYHDARSNKPTICLFKLFRVNAARVAQHVNCVSRYFNTHYSCIHAATNGACIIYFRALILSLFRNVSTHVPTCLESRDTIIFTRKIFNEREINNLKIKSLTRALEFQP